MSSTSTVEESVEVDAPIAAVYAQWTRFEDFPKFMEGIDEVTQTSDRRLRWRASIAGQEREWDADVTEQHPEERVAWASTSGKTNAGVVTFHKLDETKTRVMLQLDVEVEGVVEKVGDAVGAIDRRARGDLQRFKELVEAHESAGVRPEGWQGEVPRDA